MILCKYLNDKKDSKIERTWKNIIKLENTRQ